MRDGIRVARVFMGRRKERVQSDAEVIETMQRGWMIEIKKLAKRLTTLKTTQFEKAGMKTNATPTDKAETE